MFVAAVAVRLGAKAHCGWPVGQITTNVVALVLSYGAVSTLCPAFMEQQYAHPTQDRRARDSRDSLKWDLSRQLAFDTRTHVD